MKDYAYQHTATTSTIRERPKKSNASVVYSSFCCARVAELQVRPLAQATAVHSAAFDSLCGACPGLVCGVIAACLLACFVNLSFDVARAAALPHDGLPHRAFHEQICAPNSSDMEKRCKENCRMHVLLTIMWLLDFIYCPFSATSSYAVLLQHVVYKFFTLCMHSYTEHLHIEETGCCRDSQV